jgi:hypothetical protein
MSDSRLLFLSFILPQLQQIKNAVEFLVGPILLEQLGLDPGVPGYTSVPDAELLHDRSARHAGHYEREHYLLLPDWVRYREVVQAIQHVAIFRIGLLHHQIVTHYELFLC